MAIMGHSYGGYVALAALTLTPDLFVCGTASSTTANLLAFVSRFPKTPDNAWLRATIGDPDIPKEAELLRRVSPIFSVNRLSKPVLIACSDGVGTKLKVAAMMGVHNTVGIDLVAMSLNDALCVGAIEADFEACDRLGRKLKPDESVHTSMQYLIKGNLTRAQIETISKQLLGNDLIERFEVVDGG